MRKEERGEEGEGEKAHGFRNFFFFFLGFLCSDPHIPRQTANCKPAGWRQGGGTSTPPAELKHEAGNFSIIFLIY